LKITNLIKKTNLRAVIRMIVGTSKEKEIEEGV
jgi:hypothetical protein